MRITGRQLRQIIREEVSRSLLSEAPVPTTPAEKVAVINAIAQKITAQPDAQRASFVFTHGGLKGEDYIVLASKNPSIPIVGTGRESGFKTEADMIAAIKAAAAGTPAKVGAGSIFNVEDPVNGRNLRADMDGNGAYETLNPRIFRMVRLVKIAF
jgi:hypothetical protein